MRRKPRTYRNRLSTAVLTILLVLSVFSKSAVAPQDILITPISFPSLGHFAEWSDEHERLALGGVTLVIPHSDVQSWWSVEQFFSDQQRGELSALGYCLALDTGMPISELLLGAALCQLATALGCAPNWPEVTNHLSQLMFRSGFVTPYAQMRELETKMRRFWFEFVSSLLAPVEPGDETSEPMTPEDEI